MKYFYAFLHRNGYPFLISLFLVFTFTVKTSAQTTPPEERAALMALYNATDGPNWNNNTNWGVGDPCTNNWHGVYFHSDGTVKSIVFNRNNLRGAIPDSIAALQHLEAIRIENNELTAISTEIGKITSLQQLLLDYNSITELPPGIGSLVNLTRLKVIGNQLTTLPKEIEGLINLREIYLKDNQLELIPPALCNLTSLYALNLATNKITNVPAEIGNLSSLQSLLLSDNLISGTLPPEIGNLSRLRSLIIHNNQISELPPEIGNLTALESLRLENNQLTTLPSSMGNLTSLIYLLCTNNHIGMLPPEIGTMRSLKFLELGNNQLTSLPVEFANLNSLENVALFNNKLEGSMPVGITGLTTLRRLYLQNNQLTTIPPEIGGLTSLTILDLGENKLVSLPVELGDMSSLRILQVDNNQLTGNITPELGNLAQLEYLSLANNNLTGCFDSNLRSLCGINIVLSGNANLPDFNLFCSDGSGECTGTPQSEIDALMAIYNATDGPNWNNNTNWGVGDPYNNEWYGVTCNSEGNVIRLEFLQNNLQGSIPPAIKDLTYLTYFHSHYNFISSIPSEIGDLKNLTFLRITYYGNNPGFVSIPVEVYNLTGLTTLGLEGVGMTEIPPQIANLSNLKTLQIYQNQISELPDELFTLSHLQKLHLASNQLTVIPPGIGNLTEMRELILNYNQLTTLPPEIGNLTKMHFFNLFQNQISEIPGEMGNLIALQRLQADYNQLQSIPTGIFSLPLLWELHLSHNNLTGNIPSEVGNLSRIKSLYLNDNKLDGNIPPEMGELTTLNSLNLSNNNLSGCFHANLSSLCGINISLSGNPGLPDFDAFCSDGTGECVPPEALCADVTVFAGPDCTADASIDDGSYDLNGEDLIITQTPPGPYPLGVTPVTLTVSDGMFSAQCQAHVTVEDNLPPVPEITELPDVVGECSATIENPPIAADNCSGPVTGTTTDPVSYSEQGTYSVTWSFTDASGNTSNQQQKVIVDDITPPVISIFPNPAAILTTGNHRYTTFTIPDLVSSVTDNCSLLTIDDISIVKAESDEEEDADESQDMNDGRTSDDIIISDDCYSVQLVDESNIKGNGRVYTIFLSVDDGNGNTTVAEAEVHACKGGNPAIKDETQYTVTSKFCGIQELAQSDLKSGNIQSNPESELWLKNYPNPFNTNTIIEFNIPERGNVLIEVFDLTGQRISIVANKKMASGHNQVEFDASDLPGGIYLYRLTYSNQQLTRRMILR